MNTDRMDTSAVYGLFEELKQSLTEMTTSLKGRSEQQTINSSKIEELFGKMNTLSKQEVFSRTNQSFGRNTYQECSGRTGDSFREAGWMGFKEKRDSTSH